MACQIKRGKNGEVTQVLAANGKESLAYKSLLDVVNLQTGNHLDELQTRFKSWEGKHIRDVQDPKELALALYKQLHSPAFKTWFGDWENASPKVQKGQIRLYRGETSSEADSPAPDWVKEATKDRPKGTFFTDTAEEARYYDQKFGTNTGRISYLDIPEADLEKYRASNNEGKQFSARGLAEKEFFLPDDIASSRRVYSEGSSKVVDENGEPLVVYHGAGSQFNTFVREGVSLNFFAKSRIYADTYADRGEESINSVRKGIKESPYNALVTALTGGDYSSTLLDDIIEDRSGHYSSEQIVDSIKANILDLNNLIRSKGDAIEDDGDGGEPHETYGMNKQELEEYDKITKEANAKRQAVKDRTYREVYDKLYELVNNSSKSSHNEYLSKLIKRDPEATLYPVFLSIKNPQVAESIISNEHIEDGRIILDPSKDGIIGIDAPFKQRVKNEEKKREFDNEPVFGIKDATQAKSVFNQGSFSQDTGNIYFQKQGSFTPKANKETLAKIKEFLNRINVEVKTLQDIVVNGQRIGANGIADPLNRLIQIAQGKEDIALPEEAMHMAVELIEQTNPALFKEMMNKIGNYNMFTQVATDYRGLKDYEKDGKPDVIKLKKEAIGKVLAQTVIDRNENASEPAAALAQSRNWWQRIVDWLKALFNRADMNPFETAAKQVLSGQEIGGDLTKSTAGTFLQTNKDIIDKIELNDKNVAKVGDKYELNGAPIRKTVMDDVVELLRRREKTVGISEAGKIERQFKAESENKVKDDIKDILGRYIDDDGNRRVDELPHTNPSAANPYNNEMYNTLEEHLKERLDTYETGTKFFKSVNLYDGINTAGTVDMLAVLPSGKIDIIQFKMPVLWGMAVDVPKLRQEAYNIEIEALRKVLEKGYGVKRDQFRMTRAIPIVATYEYLQPGDPNSGLKLSELRIGSANVQLIPDDLVLPIPSTSETTGNKKFDQLISRLRGLVQKMSDEKVTPDQRGRKSARVGALLAAIRRLQVQGNAKGILSSGAAIVKAQNEKYDRLQQVINNLDPNLASIAELNKIAGEILDEKDQVELYAQLYQAFKNVFTDGSQESKDYLDKARKISDDAQDSLDKYWDMSVEFRKKKFAAKLEITDEFKPEKNLTVYRRMVRSLSQSSIKAGELLWGLVNNINNRFQLEFQDRFKETQELEKEVDKWLVGKTIKDLYNKIFAMTPEGKWKGTVIKKYSGEFYTQLNEAREKGDKKWVMANIDIQAYRQWFFEEHTRRVEDAKTARYHEDDKENQRIIRDHLSEFMRIFDIKGKTGVNTNNYKLADFPKEGKWESREYNELNQPGNEVLLKLYNHWNSRLKESFESGMIDEHNGWSWFPNVRRNLLEKLTISKADNKLNNFFSNFAIQAEDKDFGKIDPLTGKSVDEVHANYVSDLMQWVQGADGKYFQDYSNKSMDIFKVMALWDREILKYRLKTESEDLARMLAYTEENKGAIKTSRTGAIQRDKEGNTIPISNEVNTKYVQEHIASVWYSKALSDEADISIPIPYKSAVAKLNKLFGREIIKEPEEEVVISGVKGLAAMNRFFVTKTLGLNVFTAAANLFGGSVNTYINQGLFFNKADILRAEYQYTSGAFWKDDHGRKLAGLLHYLHPYLEDKTTEEIRKLSLSKAVKALSSDHLFFMQRGSDKFVNDVIAIAFIENTMLRDGKLMNIRDYARKELGYKDKYAGTYEESKEFNKKLEARIDELKKSPEALINATEIKGDTIEIPGVDRLSPTVINLRQSMIEFIKDALGNTSREDLSLYKRSVMWQSFFMFKNWIPRMLDVRGQSLKYNPGSQKYEWGRIRMLGKAVQHLGLSTVGSLLKQLGGNDKSLVEVAKKIYAEKQQYMSEQEQEFTMNEAEFVDMYIKGVRSEFKELALALGLMALLVAARAAAPDKDQDAHIKGTYKWMLRGLDKLQDEVSFFYNPKSFTDIVNGSVFPSVGMLVDIQKFLTTGMAKTWYTIIGDSQKANSEKVSKYLFKVLPVTKELMTYLALFSNDIAKEYGIRISAQNGSSR